MDCFNVSFSIEEFCSLSTKEVVKKTNGLSDKECEVLCKNLQGFDGRIIFGYSIPGVSKPIDVVLLIKGVIFVMEYRDGATEYEQHARRQAQGDAFMIKFYHNRSNKTFIIPILVASDAPDDLSSYCIYYPEKVYGVINCNSKRLHYVINGLAGVLFKDCSNIWEKELGIGWEKEWANEWEKAPFKNCPSLVEPEKLSTFVKEMLSCNHDEASRLLHEILDKIVIFVTRDIDIARRYLVKIKQSLADEVYVAEDDNYDINIGMLCSSSGLYVKGLNFDSIIAMWDADLRYNKNKDDWDFYQYDDDKWKALHDNRQTILDTYFTMLTSARRCLIIYVPEGRKNDPRLSSNYYDDTYQYLVSLGMYEL